MKKFRKQFVKYKGHCWWQWKSAAGCSISKDGDGYLILDGYFGYRRRKSLKAAMRLGRKLKVHPWQGIMDALNMLNKMLGNNEPVMDAFNFGKIASQKKKLENEEVDGWYMKKW